ncbi:MAG: SDR family NAD(P)-dependent oxidoreductase [Halioglobus sp.]
MQIDLRGHTALVTGAGKGIGRAIATAMAAAGADVALADRQALAADDDLLAGLRAGGVRAEFFAADVSRGPSVAALFSDVAQRMGAIDILVNNAGVSRVTPFLEVDEAEWDAIINTNLKSVYLCCKHALPGMLVRGSGCIINIASELGYLGRAHFAPYTASKGGVITLTRSLALEFAPAIRVNAIAPGPCDTDMLRAEITTTEQLEREVAIPMGRLGQPEEIAATAVFLASNYASFYCGDVLSPNGGSLMR